MRLHIAGDNDCARVVRDYLRTQFVVLDTPAMADYVIFVEVDPLEQCISLDSVDCPLEKSVLRHIRILTPVEIKILTFGGVQSEKECRVIVPDSLVMQDAVERGILRGFLDLRKQEELQPKRGLMRRLVDAWKQ